MRIVLLASAAIILSACSVGGQTTGPYHAPQPYMAGGYHQAPAPQHIHGQYRASKFNIEAGIGKEFIVGDKFWDEDTAVQPGVQTVSTIKMKDAFKAGTRYDLGASYALNPRLKVSATAYKTKHKGKENVEIGTFAGVTEFADVTDYDSFGFEAGLRQYAAPFKAPLVKSMRPYIEARAGAARVDDITLTNVNNGTTTFADIDAYNKSWVPTGAGLVGIETPVFNRFTMGLETGIRYNGKLDSGDTGWVAAGSFYEGANSGSDKWSIPVTLRGRFRF